MTHINRAMKWFSLKPPHSQSEFAALLGISLATLQNWEQGRRRPQGPTRMLLHIADKNPKALLDV